uniref:Ribosomal protein S11 n=1 Tax=Pteridomonas sp. YPF1301 TaxID=2766739 RepID=A0A7G1MS52_9STRA|nr:ribosomal protein S11 [Pteridomonas sp. YPF1301]
MLKIKQRFIKKFGLIYMNLTLHNCIISITDLQGNVFLWSSTGRIGFKGARKRTTFANQVTIKTIINEAINIGLCFVKFFIKQTGGSLEPLMKILKASKLEILSIWDITAISHNGCRSPKKRNSSKRKIKIK